MVHGEDISVRIFAKAHPSTIVFTPAAGSFTIISGHNRVTVGTGEPVIISRYNSQVLFKTKDGVSRLTDTLRIIPVKADNIFTVRQPGDKEKPKTLKGSLKVILFPGSLLILNITDIEAYLPGVVKAEAGSQGPSEYFKTQAVIARTFVYRHLGRHMLDGYDLCDDVHCQVYYGMIKEKVITDACNSTKGLVLVDSDSTLIISAFHANCGGQTSTSGDVWVSNEPYLISLHDSYCLEEKPLVWERKIPLAKWKSFLSSKGIPYKADTLSIPSSGIPVRQSAYIINGVKVPATEIRNRFSLKSTYFSIQTSGETIIIKGRGYGHGVGLCQDGARVMATRGKTYSDITKYYYPGTFIVNVKNARKPVRP